MAKTQPHVRLQFLPEDRRSDYVWVLLLFLGLFVIVVSWLDWMF